MNVSTYRENVRVNQAQKIWQDSILGRCEPKGSLGINTYITKSNLVLDAQIGLALPTLATGKVGVGFKGENAIITAGIRPYPSHAYLQFQWLPNNKHHSFIFSFEESANSITGNYNWEGPSFYSVRLATVGYRWNLGSKFGRK